MTMGDDRILNVLSSGDNDIVEKVLPKFLDTTADVPDPAKHRSLIAISNMRNIRDALKLEYTLAVQTMMLSVSSNSRHRRELKKINGKNFTDPVIVISSVQGLLYDIRMERIGKIVFLGSAAGMPSDAPDRLRIESMLYQMAS